jgi:hypothetical protein
MLRLLLLDYLYLSYANFVLFIKVHLFMSNAFFVSVAGDSHRGSVWEAGLGGWCFVCPQDSHQCRPQPELAFRLAESGEHLNAVLVCHESRRCCVAE